MIIDSQTNFIYLSDTLKFKYPTFFEELILALHNNSIEFDFLPGTKNVWAVDYMPIQISNNKFVRFSYQPDYLISTKKWARTISDVDTICDKIKVKTIKSNIILDGGNISKWTDRILMTTKVFVENPKYSELQLIQELKDLLEINEIYFVPVEEDDWLGHADGMARFIGIDTLLINDLKLQERANYIDFLMCLHNSKLKWEEFPFNPYENEDPDDATGLYLNYIELSDFVILPIFGLKTDDEAIKQAQKVFPNQKIIPVKSNEPAKDTGITNCLTWNIKK
ncbi:MAG: agmatine deiminase family protein [Daejeonella sp.]